MKAYLRLAAGIAAACLFVRFGSAAAMADVAAPATTSNVAPLVTFSVGLVRDVGLALLPVVAAWLATHVRSKFARDAIQAGLTRAAGGVYEAIAARGATIQSVPIKNAEIASAVNSFIAIYPSAMNTLGMTPDSVHEAIRKELGTLLAADPTVTIAPEKPPLIVVAASASPATPSNSAVADAGAVKLGGLAPSL